MGMIRSIRHNTKQGGFWLAHNFTLVIEYHSVSIQVCHTTQHVAYSEHTSSSLILGPSDSIIFIVNQILDDRLDHWWALRRLSFFKDCIKSFFKFNLCLLDVLSRFGEIHFFRSERLFFIAEMNIHGKRHGIEFLFDQLVTRVSSFSPVKCLWIEQMMRGWSDIIMDLHEVILFRIVFILLINLKSIKVVGIIQLRVISQVFVAWVGVVWSFLGLEIIFTCVWLSSCDLTIFETGCQVVRGW